jgi:hypothetical protein
MSANIELAVTERTRAAVFGLGRIAPNGKFNALYVGRSDENLAGELRRFIGQYGAFVYGYHSSPLDAFRAECELYHLLEPEDNPDHPQRPEGTAWACPLCRGTG